MRLAHLARLVRVEGSLIGDLGATRSPGEEGDLEGVLILRGTACKGSEQEQ